MKQPSRRRLLVAAAGGAGAVLLGCNGASPPRPVKPCNASNVPDGGASKPLYCLVEPTEVRIAGAAHLPVNQVALMNVDDNTAAIIAHDANGFYGLSAICSHSCCIVDICGDALCDGLLTNPGDCKVTAYSPLVGSGGAAFICACHGSEFSSDGAVLYGPATQALPAVAVRLDGDDVVVNLGVSVAPSDRVKPR